MATINPWTADEDQRLVDLHAQGMTLNVSARTLGRSPAGVSTHSKILGLSWDRSKTKAATAAKVADNRARRAELEAGLLDDAARLRGELFAPCQVFNFGGKDNTYETREVSQPPFADQKNIMAAVSIAVTGSLKIAVHDSDASHDDAKSMLTGLAAAMGLAFRAPEQNPESGIRND